jgi:hypothetical protein
MILNTKRLPVTDLIEDKKIYIGQKVNEDDRKILAKLFTP